MKKPIVKKGNRYNRLTAVRFDHKDKEGRQHWLFRCDCGNKKVVVVDSVKRGNTKSCGCLAKEINRKRLTIHGMWGSRENSSWRSMCNRCLNKKGNRYSDWGERGVTVCKRWLGKDGFQNFYKDMGKRPKGKTLDRIDNNGNYEPNNCRWATQKEQSNNMRNNIFVSVNGVKISFNELAEMFCVKPKTLWRRIYELNWDLKKALVIKN